ncbi:MAG: hypothetical protein IT440_09110 [Phycisphaeraceae bacterium]|nr:hypothetical protein [Phycisphaeraceae bacterium]
MHHDHAITVPTDHSAPSNRTDATAFTHIVMMAVISMIAVIIAILLPAVSSASIPAIGLG